MLAKMQSLEHQGENSHAEAMQQLTFAGISLGDVVFCRKTASRGLAIEMSVAFVKILSINSEGQSIECPRTDVTALVPSSEIYSCI